MIAFAYYGAKNGMIDSISPYLPACDHYCEPFCGSMAMLLNRDPSPIETANDLNGDVVNFFRVLKRRGKALVQELALTPYSRTEFEEAWQDTDDSFERARRFYVRVVMDIAKAGRKGDKSWSVNVKYLPGEHSYAPLNFLKKVHGLHEIVARLRRVQLENRPAVNIIRKFDNPGTLFYCDPPYMHETRTSKADYKFEMDLEAHIELAGALNACRGMVALSGYDHPKMDELYAGWFKVKFKPKQVPMSNNANNGKTARVTQECLWMNYDINLINGQLKLF